MKLTVCIGSSCHLKGSRQVVNQLEKLIGENGLQGEVTLSGTFCLGTCQEGVSVALDGRVYSLTPETTEDFFKTEILGRR